jgi:hypothetical protein
MGLPEPRRSWGTRRGAAGVACARDRCDPGVDAPAVGGTRGRGGGLGSRAGAARERRCDGSGPAHGTPSVFARAESCGARG